MEKLKLDIDFKSKEMAIETIMAEHDVIKCGDHWWLFKNSLATMDHIKKVFPLGRWSRDSENFLWFTLKEENHG